MIQSTAKSPLDPSSRADDEAALAVIVQGKSDVAKGLTDPDLILGACAQGSREERGQAEQERGESDRRGFAHGHASAWWILPGRTVAG